MNRISSFRELKIWQIGIEVSEQVYRLTQAFPQQERYGLSSQMQRAAVSIPSNIAEGHARDSTKEYLYHLSVSLGSLAELETQLVLSERLRYIDQAKFQPLIDQLHELGRMLRGTEKALKSKL
jgi:four helix bundle protein